MKYLKDKIAASMAKLAVHVDDGLHNDLKQMMGEHDKQIQN